MQTVSGSVRVRVVPLGGVYTFAPASPIAVTHRAPDESISPRSPRENGRILHRIKRERATTGD